MGRKDQVIFLADLKLINVVLDKGETTGSFMSAEEKEEGQIELKVIIALGGNTQFQTIFARGALKENARKQTPMSKIC